MSGGGSSGGEPSRTCSGPDGLQTGPSGPSAHIRRGQEALTPGSPGVVETSLSALLVLYGLPSGPAIAATLPYRAISFWAP